ncbi:glycine betaine ABC transporter substrate-binding protein [Azospirillum sp. SYSU D00513]|uniref:glycine betaine ABC transporter substrate-binding protein n=1 Tax=Azospirillum sp. SYSU D00513 TaxID=2812561 RepID=UPI001A96F16F|nr:glycine betaine ABC transporter substrate-binding protein [Azospirillum sp. SYSU D00513]
MNRIGKTLAALSVAAAVLAPVTGANADDKTINIGWTAWSDAEAVTKLAKKVLEDRMGYKVELTMADIGVQYQGVATGKLDGMLMSWQPATHKSYIDKVGKDLVDLGPMYTQAKLGWVIPDSIPASELKTIEDLKKPEVKAKLKGRIQGIDPGSGLMQLSEKAMKAYSLDGYQLVSASDAAMLAGLTQAVKRDDWIVVTSWSPHWMFSKWKLRYLEDPKGALGGEEHINKLVRKGFEKDHPEAHAFLTRMVLPIGDVESIMAEAQDSSYEAAVDNYIRKNPDRIESWVTGKK